MPAATVEKLLPSASLTLTINGVDYVTSKNIVSLETSWKNNIRMDAGFYPGSGFQTSGDATTGAIRASCARSRATSCCRRFIGFSLLKRWSLGTYHGLRRLARIASHHKPVSY